MCLSVCMYVSVCERLRISASYCVRVCRDDRVGVCKLYNEVCVSDCRCKCVVVLVCVRACYCV